MKYNKMNKFSGTISANVDVHDFIDTLIKSGFSIGNINFSGTCTNLPEGSTYMNTITAIIKLGDTNAYTKVIMMNCYNGDVYIAYRGSSAAGLWSAWTKLCTKSDVVQKFDTAITPSAGVTGLYDVVVDCLTQFVPVLRAKGAGSYSGLLTCTSAWSGQYNALVYDALVVVDGTYRFGNDIYTFKAVHNGTDLKVFADAAEEGNPTVNADVVDTSQYNNFTWKRRGKYVVASMYVGATKSINPATGTTVLATGFPVPFGSTTSMFPVSWAKYNNAFTVQINSSGELVMYSKIDIETAQVYSGQCTITYECV